MEEFKWLKIIEWIWYTGHETSSWTRLEVANFREGITIFYFAFIVVSGLTHFISWLNNVEVDEDSKLHLLSIPAYFFSSLLPYTLFYISITACFYEWVMFTGMIIAIILWVWSLFLYIAAEDDPYIGCFGFFGAFREYAENLNKFLYKKNKNLEKYKKVTSQII